MAEKSSLSIVEQQKLKVLLKAIYDADETYSERDEPSIADNCISERDIQRIIDLGLGRGVDVTDPTPWQNKSSFQVRPVVIENVIGTEEGGCVQSYEKEVTSVSETRGLASASITDPKSAVSIGVEGEYSHSSSNRYRVIGTKVLNCTISFKDHCDDADFQPQMHFLSFEAWLCRWILRKAGVEVNMVTKKQSQQLAEFEKRKIPLESRVEKLKSKVKEHQSLLREIQLQMKDSDEGEDDANVERVASPEEIVGDSTKMISPATHHSDGEYSFVDYRILESGRRSTITREVKDDKVKKDKRSLILQAEEMSKLVSTEQELLVNTERELLSSEEQSLKLEMQIENQQFSEKEHSAYILFSKHNIEEEKVVECCGAFISKFRITHYVSSIQLGASGYEVITESKIARKLRMQSHLGVEKIAAGNIVSTHSRSTGSKASNLKKIGIIEIKNGVPTVKRGTHHEAVVGIQVKPISDLISARVLRTPLKRALLQYVRSKGESCAGPFLIHCATSGASCLYWTVDPFSYCVTADSNESNASKFYVKATNNAKHLDEFYICYFDVDLSEHRKIRPNDQFDETKEYVEPIPRYLQTPIDMLGHNPGPLKLGYHIKIRNTRLVLVNAVRSHRQPPVSLSVWMSGREMCFIQCARRRQRKGYIAVTMDQFRTGYHTCCVHSKCDESQPSSFMLFQIVQTLEARKDRQTPVVLECGIPGVQFPFTSSASSDSSPPLHRTRLPDNPIRPSPLTKTVSGDTHQQTLPPVLPPRLFRVSGTIVHPLPPPPSPSWKPRQRSTSF